MSWQIPQGIEVLVKKASVDAEFAASLLANRAEAAEEIGLVLETAEAMMLSAVPAAQLKAIIARTTVPQEHRRAFLGKAAAAMLAALAAADAGLASAGTGIGGGKAVRMGAAGGARIDLPQHPRQQPRQQTVADRVIALIARQLGVSTDRISRETTFAGDLRADARQREAIRQALEKQLGVGVPGEAFAKFAAVGDAIDYVQLMVVVQPQVIDAIARSLAVDKQQITRQTSLLRDLGTGTRALAQLRIRLSSQFRVYISAAAFNRLQTVGEVVDYIGSALRRRQAAAPKQDPVPPSPVSRGARPDRPLITGIRPGSSR